MAADRLNPKYFVEVVELTTDGRERVIHTTRRDSVGVLECERIGAEVANDSKLVVRINQRYLQDVQFAGTFAVAGTLVTTSGSRPIEIPGYSVIGKASELAPVSVGAMSGLDAALRELREERRTIDSALHAAADSANKRRAAFQTRLDQLNKQTNRWLSTETDAQSEVERVRTDLHADSSRSVSDTSAKREIALSLRVLPVYQAKQKMAQDSAKFYGDSAAATLRRGNQDVTRDYLLQAQAILQERRHARIALQVIASPTYAPLVAVFARSIRRFPDVVLRLAANADTSWGLILGQNLRRIADADSLELLRSTVTGFNAGLEDLVGFTSSTDTESYERVLAVSSMKDAEIDIRATGAAIGDRISLAFTDSIAGQMGSTRHLSVSVIVREFGLVRRVSDAVLLMNVPGLREGTTISAAQSVANASNRGATLDFPVNLRAGAAPGVSFGWTYLPRPDDRRGPIEMIQRVIEFIQPGLGLTASVPNVAHKVVTITPAADAKEEAKPPEVTYTAGAIVTVFDGAAAWSIGRTLSGDKTRTYTALGISFLAATEKAKQLFKNLGANGP